MDFMPISNNSNEQQSGINSLNFINPELPSFSENHFKNVKVEIPKLNKVKKGRGRPRKRPSSPNSSSSFISPNASTSSLVNSTLSLSSIDDVQIKKNKTEWDPPDIKFKKKKEFQNSNVQIFYPTLEEMKNFSKYIQKIETEYGAHISCGICKIVPPKEWSARPTKSDDYSGIDDIIIEKPVKETISTDKSYPDGCYVKSNRVYKQLMTGEEFRRMATSPTYDTPAKIKDVEELEKYYWKNVLKGTPIYGADTPGTLYEESVDTFRITKLNTILDLLDEYKEKIKGVNTPYLYFGMYKTTFPWHAEDMDLYSINYVHYGEPKFWYGIPSESADKFERLASQIFSDGPQLCRGFLRHKVYMISPSTLDTYGIPYGKMVQYPGEFVVTFPRGYHMGFNTGFNVAEATNFAIDRWIDFGKNTVLCNCSNDKVEINMKIFMEKYRPGEYNSWYNFWYTRRPLINQNEIKRKITSFRLRQLLPQLTLEQRLATLALSEQQIKAERRFAMNRALFDYAPCFGSEQDYNRKQGKIFPNCAVCSYLVPDLDLGYGEEFFGERVKSSPRYIVDQLITKLPDNNGSDKSTEVNMSIIDDLIECSTCRVVVHKKCYTDLPIENDENLRSGYYSNNIKNEKWRCYRCFDRSFDLIEKTVCHLCRMRGGALIPSITGGNSINEYVHMICAITHRRTKILCSLKSPIACILPTQKIFNDKDDNLRFSKYLNPYSAKLEQEYLDVPSSFIKTSKIMQCELCSHNSEGLHTCQSCIDDICPRYFHTTCAKFLDIVFERREYPYLLAPICVAHKVEHPECYIDENNIEYNEAVIVKKFNNKEIELKGGLNKKILKNQWAIVEFMDNSQANDIVMNEIIKCECNEQSCDNVNHIYSSLMTIDWNNDKYLAYYRGMKKEFIYKIELDTPYIDENGKEYDYIEIPSEDAVRSDVYKNIKKRRGRPKKQVTPPREFTSYAEVNTEIVNSEDERLIENDKVKENEDKTDQEGTEESDNRKIEEQQKQEEGHV